jgi:Tfp pilus assembly protein PilN
MSVLNLATRPFRNERLPSMLFLAAVVLIAGITVDHALVIRSLLSQPTTELHKEAAALEAELPTLRAQIDAGANLTPDTATVARWKLLKNLVDKRTLSWTDLFARLEAVTPSGVQIASITPTVKDDVVSLDLVANVASPEEGYAFAKRLQERPEFSEVYPRAQTIEQGDGGRQGQQFRYTMRYHPLPREAASKEDKPAADEAAPAEGQEGIIPTTPTEGAPPQ